MRDNFSSYESLGSPNRDNSQSGLDLGYKAEIRIKAVKIKSAKPTVIKHDREKLKDRGISVHLIIK